MKPFLKVETLIQSYPSQYRLGCVEQALTKGEDYYIGNSSSCIGCIPSGLGFEGTPEQLWLHPL
ncbi:hypothetical protein [Scytonema sp. PCC 10023]|uniref:hypothetical protein n=1 Tax=Scytonema sp. PCC 10023 TaxID=1680591 RepID=UPI0039C66049